MRNHKVGGLLKEGDLVLIRDEPYKTRLTWPVGRVVQIYMGQDGIGRSASVKTSTGTYSRPIQRLYHLEMQPEGATQCLQESELIEEDQSENEVHNLGDDQAGRHRNEKLPAKVSYVTSRGRKTKAPPSYG